ncbi:MAG: 2,3-bisphosphoglycerate-independent phosphoglycerate mutase [Bacilli bacterium]|nr:2,3-bisphosphoglycerate-independent phosphoglycerate mutase [Bacilli bacterium]MBN2696036.1 2,3-bisphosphoglycerate-independent phosphoglycerate mutase [Bacilli bacterium]
MKKPVVLMILDGMAISDKNAGNAYELANKPHLDLLFNEFPWTTMDASGEAVGLPEGQMGNSEVGHLNLGAGRVVYQSLTRVNVAIKDGTYKDNPAYNQAFEYVKSNNSKLHIFGLLSDGGVHSHIRHIKYLFRVAKEKGVSRAFFHAFLDGRDVPPQSAVTYILDLEKDMAENEFGKIATVSGRYYAMDRDKNWDRIKLAYDAMSFGKAKHFATAASGVEASYAEGVNDEFVIPFVVETEGMINDNDAIIFANFRPDRAIEIGTAYSNPQAAPKLDTTMGPKNILFVSTMKYAESVAGPVAFDLNDLKDTYGDYISELGLKQLRIAETEKYAHVTFFFDGGVDKEIKGAKRVLIPSPKVATYDLKPEMSAFEITDAVIEELDSGEYDTVILNYANGDMVGHTGVIPAAIKAVETVDQCVGRVVDKILEMGGVALITADHGNCEKMLDDKGKPFTAHTTNRVFLIVTKKGLKLKEGGSLCDIAPTMLELMNLSQPEAMTGKSLIDHN